MPTSRAIWERLLRLEQAEPFGPLGPFEPFGLTGPAAPGLCQLAWLVPGEPILRTWGGITHRVRITSEVDAGLHWVHWVAPDQAQVLEPAGLADQHAYFRTLPKARLILIRLDRIPHATQRAIRRTRALTPRLQAWRAVWHDGPSGDTTPAAPYTKAWSLQGDAYSPGFGIGPFEPLDQVRAAWDGARFLNLGHDERGDPRLAQYLRQSLQQRRPTPQLQHPGLTPTHRLAYAALTKS